MAFTVPNAKNFNSPLNAVPLDWLSPPVEGAKGIQCSVLWDNMQSGVNRSIYFNLQNNAPLNFSKIRALIFDNSQNGSDVQVIFPDTETTMTVPAYTPYAVIPVFTNVTQFYLVCPNGLATDKTGFMILNTLPPPLAVPTTQEQNFSAVGPVNVAAPSGPSTQQLVAANVTGTLENVFIGFDLTAIGTVCATVWSLEDGTGQIIASGRINANNTAPTGIAFQSDGIRIRFSGGILLRWTSAGSSLGYLSPNLYYRTP